MLENKIFQNQQDFSGILTEGLPREIELRQKQYEYYRNMLLDFPKPKEA
jgi:type I restriction enzyme S subunit